MAMVLRGRRVVRVVGAVVVTGSPLIAVLSAETAGATPTQLVGLALMVLSAAPLGLGPRRGRAAVAAAAVPAADGGRGAHSGPWPRVTPAPAVSRDGQRRGTAGVPRPRLGVLRTRSPVRPLSLADRDDALDVCARDLPRGVFVAARVLEGARTGSLASVLGHRVDGELTALCWASANVVPVGTTEESRAAFADRVRRWRGRCASVFGPRDEVEGLWQHLEPHWGPARAVRDRQPLLVADRLPSTLGVELDPRVRPARVDEVDLVLPAAEHMFTAEIGYPPYRGSDRGYRASLASLAARGHTYVVVEGGRVVFKTDIGSLALGCAQLQGVWLAPELRGRGLAVPMLASVVEQVMVGPAPLVTLYVNDFNTSARATYARLGFREVGDFATVLL